MLLPSGLKPNDVLVIALEGDRRDVLGSALRKDGFKPHFTSNAETLPTLLDALKPATLLHDWPTFDLGLATRVQQRLGKAAAYVGLCRIVYAEVLTPQLIALAHDSGVRRLVSRVTAPPGLVSALRMALTTLRSMPELQRIVLDAQLGVTADPDAIDLKIRTAYEMFSHDPVVQLEFGKLCLRDRAMKAATSIADGLLEADQLNVRALNLRARIHMLEGDTDVALKLLEKANVLSPFSVERLVMLGDAFCAIGQTSKGAKHYCEALKLDVKDGAAAQGLVGASLSDGDVDAVFSMIRDSLSEEEGASLFNNAAVIAVRSNKMAECFKLYDCALKVVRSERLRATIHFNIGLAFRRINEESEAQKNFRIAIKLDPGFDKAQRQVKGKASA